MPTETWIVDLTSSLSIFERRDASRYGEPGLGKFYVERANITGYSGKLLI